MTAAAVFFRTLLKSSAIFIGAAAVFLHPSLEWHPALEPGTTVGAQQSAAQTAIGALIAALKDEDAGVRRAAAAAIAEIGGTGPHAHRRPRPAVAQVVVR